MEALHQSAESHVQRQEASQQGDAKATADVLAMGIFTLFVEQREEHDERHITPRMKSTMVCAASPGPTKLEMRR